MARRYEIDELLWLRSSPLVAKPPGLPPIEEWMYVPEFDPTVLACPHVLVSRIDHVPSNRPQPDPTTQRKQQNPRDPNNPPETTTNRRPSFFEARHISRSSNSGMLPYLPARPYVPYHLILLRRDILTRARLI